MVVAMVAAAEGVPMMMEVAVAAALVAVTVAGKPQRHLVREGIDFAGPCTHTLGHGAENYLRVRCDNNSLLVNVDTRGQA